MKHSKLLAQGNEAVIGIIPRKRKRCSPSPGTAPIYDRGYLHHFRLCCCMARLLHRSLADIDWDAARFTERQRLLRALAPLESDIALMRLVADAPAPEKARGARSRKEAGEGRRPPHAPTPDKPLS